MAALVTIAPGADFAPVSRRALSGGVRTAVITASGVCSGVLVWGALSAVGIAALLAARGELTDEQLEQARLKLLSDRSPAVEELLPGARAA